MSEENLCHQSSTQFTSTELENEFADSENSISAELCRIDSESQVSSYGMHFGVEIAETVVSHNAKNCTAVSDTKNGHVHLEKSASEAENQSDMFDFNRRPNCSSSDCFNRNLGIESNGGLWEIDNIEDCLKKFVSEEITDDVSGQVFQNSDKFNNGENTSLKVVVPDELDLDPANKCCRLPSSSVGNFSQRPVNAMNYCDGLLEGLSDSTIDHCNSECVPEQFSLCDRISELNQLQSPQNNCLRTSNSLSNDAYAQHFTEENLEHVQFEATPRVVDTNGGIPAEQCSQVIGNHEHFMSDSVVEPNSENAVSQTCGSDMVCAAECSNSSDLDRAVKADQSGENFLAEQLSSEKDVNIDGPLLNQVQESNSVSNSFVSNNLTSACQNTSVSDSNCAILSSSAVIIEDSVPTSLIADSSVVLLPSTLLQSANSMPNECPSSVSNSEGIIMKLLDDVVNLLVPNEKVQEVVANGLPADGQTSDCGIIDVIGKIKKEKPWSSDDRTCASDWKEPIPYGLKQCYCPHGYISPTAGHFHCQECGLSSRFSSNIINHEVVKHRVKHSGVKVHSCSQCSSIFVCASELRRHVTKHHGRVGDGKTQDKQLGSDSELCEPGCVSSSPKRTKSRRCRRHSALVSRGGKSSEVTFRHLGPQKRKSYEPAPINFEKLKPRLNQAKDKGIPLPEEYKVTVLTAGQTVTTRRPAYDGPLLPVLLKPTNICKFCGQRFSRNIVQSRHYAQVHRLYLRGESVFRCTACKYCTTYPCDFKVHVESERHRTTASEENEKNLSTGEALLTDDDADADACHKNIIYSPKTKRRKPNSLSKIVKKPFIPSGLKSVGRKVTRDNCSKTDSIVKDDVSRFANQKLKMEVSKCYPHEKIKTFFGLMRNAKENVGDCSNINGHFPSKTATNACVSGHACNRECICSFDLCDEIASNVSKQSCIRSELDDKRSSGSTAEVSRDEFNPIIVESYSCTPSTWSNTPSEKELADLPSIPKSTGRTKLTKTKLKSSSISFCDSKMRKTEDDRPCSRSVSPTADSPSAQKPPECIDLKKRKLKLTSLSFHDKETQKTEDNRLCSRSISTMAKGVRFYQNTKDRLLSSVVAQNANPTSTCEDNIPASKFQMPVTVEKLPPHVGKDLMACKDSGNPVVIQVSDEESESSNSLTSTASSKHGVKTKQIVSSSSADPLRPGSVNSSVSGNACSLTDVIELDDDSDDGNIVTESLSGSTVAVSSESSHLTVASYDKDASLSEFSSEVLFSELKNRRFVRLCHCGVYFLDSDIYNLHCAWHLDGDPLKCNFCSVDNKDWYEFYSHILNHSK